MTPNKPKKRIRQSVKQMVTDGISPTSIVFAHGQIMTPDERDLLLKYERQYEYERQRNDTK